jgi:hypothetical protein
MAKSVIAGARGSASDLGEEPSEPFLAGVRVSAPAVHGQLGEYAIVAGPAHGCDMHEKPARILGWSGMVRRALAVLRVRALRPNVDYGDADGDGAGERDRYETGVRRGTEQQALLEAVAFRSTPNSDATARTD